MVSTDLIIIGAGPGGYRAAEYAAKQGLKVVVFEDGEVGGTCLNVGCIPTKTYVHAASFDDAKARMSEVVPLLRQGVEGILAHPNITLVREKGTFVDAHTVNGYTAKNIIIATGSSAKLLPLPDIHDPRLVTSTELLQMTTLPKRLCIIGAGVIGMEFASIFQRFGSEVTVIEYLKECLPMLDSDIAKRLRKLMEKRGITFKMKTAVQTLADIDADVILMATGRKPNVEGLNLEALGVTLEKNGAIPVDENFQVTSLTSHQSPIPSGGAGGGLPIPSGGAEGGLSHLYAIGDVNGRQMLAHAAEMQAMRTVNHILGRQDGIRFDIMPSAIFTDPEAACVGVCEGEGLKCRKAFWRANGKAQAMGESEGMLKLFSDADDRMVGCHAYGAHAADMIQEVSALMCRNTTVSQLRDMVHIHPTLGEILRSAAEQE
jgi:dihydrolipoamide dehydrogenase